jgi:hypothetical protein
MVSYVEYSIDERFKDVFVISYRAFITADALLDHLIQEYHYAETDSTLGAYAVTRQIAYVFQPHSRIPSDLLSSVLKLMHDWLDQCYIEKNPDFLKQVMDFAASAQSIRALREPAWQLWAVADRRVSRSY